jgi:hypothetical protein
MNRPFMAISECMPFRETFNSYTDWKRRLERRDNAGLLSGGHYSCIKPTKETCEV